MTGCNSGSSGYSLAPGTGSVNNTYNQPKKLTDMVYSPYEYEPCEKHPVNSNKRFVLSLRNLIKKSDGNKKEAVRLENIGWLEGYVLDKQNEDILLFGRENADWPVLYTDDLLYLLKNVRSGDEDPSCSLDPIPDDIKEFNREAANKSINESFQSYYDRISKKWGDQKVSVWGVDKNSCIASIMLQADYEMKKISQGILAIPSVQSIIDINLSKVSDSRNSGMGQPQMSRFWFKCEKNSPVFQASDDIVMLEFCDVIVLTEAQKTTAEGKLYDSGEKDEDAELFADNLSRNLRTAAINVKSIAQLENLYRLYALLNAMKFRNDLQDFNPLLNSFGKTFSYVRNYNIPEALPGLTNGELSTAEYPTENGKRIEHRFFFVCGGVHLNGPVTSDRIREGTTQLSELRDQILNSRSQAGDMISWPLGVTVMNPAPSPVRKFRFKSIELPGKLKFLRK